MIGFAPSHQGRSSASPNAQLSAPDRCALVHGTAQATTVPFAEGSCPLSTYSCSVFAICYKLRLQRILTLNVAIIGANRYYLGMRGNEY